MKCSKCQTEDAEARKFYLVDGPALAIHREMAI